MGALVGDREIGSGSGLEGGDGRGAVPLTAGVAPDPSASVAGRSEGRGVGATIGTVVG